MSKHSFTDFSLLDKPEVLQRLFHPRRESHNAAVGGRVMRFMIPVEDGVSIGARFYPSDKSKATILFFHGNGEIVADYAETAGMFTKLKINFFPVDYRGYGLSGGTPTVSAMLNDCHKIFEYAVSWLDQNGYSGPIIVMGRSLGSASALELASNYQGAIDGLIIESGFAHTEPLLKYLGVKTADLGIEEDNGLGNHYKIRSYTKPTLITHAERDHIIPISEGKALFDSSPSVEKTFLRIPNANHNTVFYFGMRNYLVEVKKLATIVEVFRVNS